MSCTKPRAGALLETTPTTAGRSIGLPWKVGHERTCDGDDVRPINVGFGAIVQEPTLKTVLSADMEDGTERSRLDIVRIPSLGQVQPWRV